MSADILDSDPSALLEFRAQNARSFRDEVTLSMAATTLSEPHFAREVQWREGGRLLSVLPAAGVFGSNASGKSNLLEIMNDMRRHVVFSFRRGRPSGGISRHPFLLDEESKANPSRYEVDVVLEGVRHRYGFELDDDRVIEEWAHRYPKGKAALLFSRSGSEVKLGAYEKSRGRAVLKILRPNALFLSTAASASHPLLLPLYEWFEHNLMLADADTRISRIMFSAEMLGADVYGKALLGLLQAADLGIVGTRKVRVDQAEQERYERFVRFMRDDDPDDEDVSVLDPIEEVRFVHSGVDGEFEMDDDEESRGTMVWFGLIGPVVRALESGTVLLVDELDASLHPDLAKELLRVFQDPETNTRNAQLVFNSHDMRLLGDASGNRPLGRDQIWFTEKLNDGSTRLYPLTDFEPRKHEAIGKRYLQGYYGARPIISVGDSDSAIDLVTAGSK